MLQKSNKNRCYDSEVLDIRSIHNTIERHLPPPIHQGYAQLLGLGRLAAHYVGCPQAIDNTVREQHNIQLRHVDRAEAQLVLEPKVEASDEALGEMAALRRFIDSQGPTTQAELAAIEMDAQPEAFTLKVLDRILAEEIPDPPPPPSIPRARNASD